MPAPVSSPSTSDIPFWGLETKKAEFFSEIRQKLYLKNTLFKWALWWNGGTGRLGAPPTVPTKHILALRDCLEAVLGHGYL